METQRGPETSFHPFNGWIAFVLNLGHYALGIWATQAAIRQLADPTATGGGWLFAGGIVTILFAIFCSIGFFIVNPNEAKALLLLGTYKGTVHDNGFWWGNPLFLHKLVSLRARNLNGEKLKVNDKSGNPIEIAAVIVWQVKDTFKALFEVDDYKHYVHTQSEAAVRHLAGSYPYDAQLEKDDHETDVISLRAGRDQVNGFLEVELRERLAQAGVEVLEARLSHLAYAPEIAAAMLQRQQAQAVVAARTRIVDGAVGMVEMALDQLSKKGVVELDNERRAAMVSNLMVVLCGDKAPHPVVNTGSLYT